MKQNQIKIIALEPKLDGNLYESNPDNYSFPLITFIDMFYQQLRVASGRRKRKPVSH